MTEAQHTPGPWRFEKLKYDEFGEGYIYGPHDQTIAHHGDRSLPKEVNLANGAVLGAAHDMLEALIDLCNRVDEDTNYVPESEAYLRARAAIAKATGA